MTFLKLVDVSDNFINFQQDLPDLEQLFIFNCSISCFRELPITLKTLSLILEDSSCIKDLYPLSSCPQLESLTIVATMTNISPLSRLQRLENLCIKECEMVFDVSPLSTCQQLKNVCFRGCKLIDLSPISNCQRLQSLGFQACSQLVELTQLTPSISNFHHITSLSLESCCQLVDISPLTTCKTIRKIDLSFCLNVNFAPLADCNRLQHIELRGSDYYHAWDDNVSQDMVEELRKILPHVTVGYCKRCPIGCICQRGLFGPPMRGDYSNI